MSDLTAGIDLGSTYTKAVIVDADGNVIHTHSGAEFEDITGGAVTWDGRDDSGQAASGGVYVYRITSPKFNATRKMTLIK